MKYAVISDIHANLEALQKALQVIASRHVDEIICLGDVVGYGASPNECVDLVRARCAATVLGNHDAAALDPTQAEDFNVIARRAIGWTSERLTQESRAFLSALPMETRKGQLLFVHSSPRSPESWDYILGSDDASTAFRYFTEQLCFIGHTHVPGVFSHNGRAMNVSGDDRYLVNVGSVGQPRDGNPMLAFGIFDAETWTYELVRSEYDIQSAADRITSAGLPKELAYRLMYGT